MIRTSFVDLTVIPAAHRRKLPSGGAGTVILRSGVKQPGIASIGKAISCGNTPAESYHAEAFRDLNQELRAKLKAASRSKPE
ncbi:MAG: hypothetical protein IKO91_03235 [Oscillospiraceae bacterium]|nr:hypothetical protein [Oscillospiraceae bacterium]